MKANIVRALVAIFLAVWIAAEFLFGDWFHEAFRDMLRGKDLIIQVAAQHTQCVSGVVTRRVVCL